MRTTTVPSQYVLPDGQEVSTDNLRDLLPRLRELGEGASRRAYELPDGAVLKVDLGRSRYGNCHSEIRAWETLSTSEVAPYLAPILAGDPEGGWLVMVKVERRNSAGQEAGNHLPSNDLYRHGIRDMHGYNVGWITTDTGEEVPVVLDYAFNGESRGPVFSDLSDLHGGSDCECFECLAGSQTRNHAAGTTCGHESCEGEMCHPYGRYCAGREDCNAHPDSEVEMPNGDYIGLCADCRPNTAFYGYVHGKTFRDMHPQLPGFALWSICQRRTDKGAGVRTSVREAALI